MLAVTAVEEEIIHSLRETRSVDDTARRLEVPVPQVQRVAMLAFGLGRLEVDLVDY